MKTNYLLLALLTLGIPGIALAQESSNQNSPACQCEQADSTCICLKDACNCKKIQSTDNKELTPRSPLQQAVINAGQQKGKARAQQLAKQETLPLLKKAYRESSIGRRGPDQFALYYKAYKHGYRQLLAQDSSGIAQTLGSKSGLKASRSHKKRPSPGMVRFQATQSHPEWEGNEMLIHAYTQAF